MRYRAEVDGLRAISVVAVILFHAGFEAFSGGFVGVDVFFVISGYLITTLLVQELSLGRFKLSKFYERRARRILPALFFMMLASIPFAWLWMWPLDFKIFSQSFLANSVFASNFFFWRQGDYFGPIAEEQPLLHTWSLSVEEQFYLIFPLFLMLIWRLGNKRVFFILSTLAIASLLLSHWGTSAFPSAGFYLAPTRAWELIAGSIAALIVRRGVTANGPLALTGLAAILVSIFLFDASTPFPGFYALLPVVGAMLLLIFAGEESMVTKLLRTKALVSVGLISYSAYLWHQPMFAFARIRLHETPSAGVMIVLSLLSLLIAFFSYRFIEQPFRQPGKFSVKGVLSFSMVGILGIASLGMLGASGDGFRFRFEPFLSTISYLSLGDRQQMDEPWCSGYSDPNYPMLRLCESGDRDSQRLLVAYGDSHLDAVGFRLEAMALAKGIRVVGADVEGCGTIPGITVGPLGLSSLEDHVTKCKTGLEQMTQFVMTNNADVLIVSRWTFQMFPAPGYVDELNFDNGVGGIENDLGYRRNVALSPSGEASEDWADKRIAFSDLLDRFAATGAKVFLSYPIPEIGWDIAKENLQSFRGTGEILTELKYPSETYYLRNGPAIEVLDAAAIRHANIELIRIDLRLCEEISVGYCVAQNQDSIFYLDDDHVSDAGADLLLKDVSLLN